MIHDVVEACLRAALHPIRGMCSTQTAAEIEEWLRHEFARIEHHFREQEAPQPGVMAPPPEDDEARALARMFAPGADPSMLTPEQVRAVRAARATRNMTATEVHERQEEIYGRMRRQRESARREIARAANQAAQAIAATDLAALGTAVLEVRPGRVMAIDPAHFNVGEYVHPMRARPGIRPGDRDDPEPQHLSRESQARAKALLWSYLSNQQRDQLFLLNYFVVKGSRSGKVYRIANAFQGNIIREDGHTYCLVPEEPMPQWDQLLAQKLMIETQEQRFLKLAARQDGQTVEQAFLTQFAQEVMADMVGRR